MRQPSPANACSYAPCWASARPTSIGWRARCVSSQRAMAGLSLRVMAVGIGQCSGAIVPDRSDRMVRSPAYVALSRQARSPRSRSVSAGDTAVSGAAYRAKAVVGRRRSKRTSGRSGLKLSAMVPDPAETRAASATSRDGVQRPEGVVPRRAGDPEHGLPQGLPAALPVVSQPGGDRLRPRGARQHRPLPGVPVVRDGVSRAPAGRSRPARSVGSDGCARLPRVRRGVPDQRSRDRRARLDRGGGPRGGRRATGSPTTNRAEG